MKRVETLRVLLLGAQTPSKASPQYALPRSPRKKPFDLLLGLTAQRLRTLSCQAWRG